MVPLLTEPLCTPDLEQSTMLDDIENQLKEMEAQVRLYYYYK